MKEGRQMKKKILVPLDGSDLAACTLSHVKDLASAGVIEDVTLLNVFGPLEVPLGEGYNMSSLKNFQMLRDESLANSKKYLDGLKTDLTAAGISVRTDSIEGKFNVAETIAEYAEKNRMDLIVIATHGRSGLKKLLLGSVATGVVRQSNVPVYLIRPAACRL
jgi:nucleotide-binding universal stress UspA family protein